MPKNTCNAFKNQIGTCIAKNQQEDRNRLR